MRVDCVNQTNCVRLQTAERYPRRFAERVIHDYDRIITDTVHSLSKYKTAQEITIDS